MTDTNEAATPFLSGYQLRLPAYEGPLDILLRLIERSQLAIEDISLVTVTGQFLHYVAGLANASPDVIADFSAVGARLTVLKTRSLLPRPPVLEEVHEQSDLTVQLREYKRIKDLARHLGTVQETGFQAYTSSTKGAVVLPSVRRVATLAQHEPELLLRSLRRRLEVVPRAAQSIRQRRVVSLPEVITRLSRLISRSSVVRFSHIVHRCETRTEVATAFLAVLVLIRRQTIDVSQSDVFSDISLTSRDVGSSTRHLDSTFDEDPGWQPLVNPD